jgi:hypothetical protein
MVAVTYDVARVPAGKAAPKAARAETAAPRKPWYVRSPRKPWYVRYMDALIEARTQLARREIARHIHLLPYSLDERGNRIVRTSSKDMPFGGW